MNKIESFEIFISKNETKQINETSDYNERIRELGKDSFNRSLDFEYEKISWNIEKFKETCQYLLEDTEKLIDIVMNFGMEFDEKFINYFYYEIADVEYGIEKNGSDEARKLIKYHDIDVFDLLINHGYYNYSDQYMMVFDDTVFSFNKENNPFKNRKFVEFFVYKIWGLYENDMIKLFEKIGYDDRKTFEENKKNLIKYYPENLIDLLYKMYESWCKENNFDVVSKQ